MHGVRTLEVKFDFFALLPRTAASTALSTALLCLCKLRICFRQNRELGFPLDDIRELIALAADADRPCADALSVVKMLSLTRDRPT
ncbi:MULTISPECIES: MerR family DNA-binding protein [Pseudomonas]|uniref:MerR family DNA-binding protein n=1 Tax=Pseudomonas coronafaciens pv. coronafaciens TaxID=235275 RepID=A0AAE6UPM6_9PSED|nr:hypothetical protein CCL09_14485 [Pseudomonas congelans]QGT84807.1 MerR family DNA-binding protein [Pseudomonas coronafaciens pv. coronafaciens]QVX13920.1 MerR family DNA-binding protein [Pseudomonas congelans]